MTALKLLFAILLLSHPQSTAKLNRNRESEVIELSLLQFLKNADWQVVDWKNGDLVVVNPEFSKRTQDLGELLDRMIWHYGHSKDEHIKADLELLKKIKKDVGNEGVTEPGQTKLKELDLDSRIVVESRSWPIEDRFRQTKTTNRLGVSGVIRIVTWLNRPMFSKDGQYAFVTASAPWSIHGADIHFILRRKDDKWSVLLVVPFIYV